MNALLSLVLTAAVASGDDGNATRQTTADNASSNSVAPTKNSGAEKRRVLVLDLELLEVDKRTGLLANGEVSTALSKYQSLEVITQRDLVMATDLEAQKQLMGCDTNSCLAEIAGAMGTRYVVYGLVGRVGETLTLQLNLFDAGSAKPISRDQMKQTSEELFLREAGLAATRLIQPLLLDGEKTVVIKEVDSQAPSWGLIVGSGGALLTVSALTVSAALIGYGFVINGQVADPNADGKEKEAHLKNVLPLVGAIVGSGLVAAVGLATAGVGGALWAIE